MYNEKHVVLGLSGGVDSTAAALLLQEQGYQVTGLYFDVIKQEDGRRKAEQAAQELDIPFLYRDVSAIFEKIVIENFCREYRCGRTPNPCIICNPAVKFQTLVEAADEVGAAYIATGHYADTIYDPEQDLWMIRCASSKKKDQSYMLYRLGQDILSRLLLPLNRMEDKAGVRAIARERDLTNWEAKDSQEICFIPDNEHYRDFLKERGYEAPIGDFVDSSGRILGEHRGIFNYTIGQRKGLGIALGKPAFVTKIDSGSNQVVLGDSEELFTKEVISDNNLLLGKSTQQLSEEEGEALMRKLSNRPLTGKIRYAARPAKVTLQLQEDGRILSSFQEPQRAVTPGQSIVFYQEDRVIGGGFIESE